MSAEDRDELLDDEAPTAVEPEKRNVVLRLATNLFLVLSLVSFLGLAVGPHVLGYRTQTMLTGSMSPYIKPGDVIVSTPYPASRIVPGDVISFHVPLEDKRVETHRVVKVIRQGDGRVAVQTKGDANAARDSWTAIIDDDQAWKVRFVVPFAGDVVRTLRKPGVNMVLQYGMPILLVIWALRAIWGAPRKTA